MATAKGRGRLVGLLMIVGPALFVAAGCSGDAGSSGFSVFSGAGSGGAGGDLGATLGSDVSTVHTPEPVSLTLFGGGVAGLALLRRRKARGRSSG